MVGNDRIGAKGGCHITRRVKQDLWLLYSKTRGRYGGGFKVHTRPESAFGRRDDVGPIAGISELTRGVHSRHRIK
jgi:hypothetical protein